MPSEIAARASPLSDASDDRDYQAFHEALSASARGRAFLDEYARRNRKAETEQLLAAIDRLRLLVPANAAGQASEGVKCQLRELLDDIAAAQSELEASVLAIKSAKFAELATLVEQRISNILASLNAEQGPAASVASAPGLDDVIESGERAHLAVVPLPEQPELPIPTPAASQPPTIALVQSEPVMAEVAFVVESAPRPHAQHEEALPDLANAGVNEPKKTVASPKNSAANVAPSADPLASIKALSEEERLALFT